MWGTHIVEMLSLTLDAFIDDALLLWVVEAPVEVFSSGGEVGCPRCSQRFKQAEYFLAVLDTLGRIDLRNGSSFGLIRIED